MSDEWGTTGARVELTLLRLRERRTARIDRAVLLYRQLEQRLFAKRALGESYHYNPARYPTLRDELPLSFIADRVLPGMI